MLSSDQRVRVACSSSKSRARLLQSTCSSIDRAASLLVAAAADRLLLLRNARARLPAASRSSSSRATDKRDEARANSSATCAARDRAPALPFPGSAAARGVLQLFGQCGDLAFELFQRPAAVSSTALLLALHLAGQLAQFALQRQRTAARLLAAAHRVAVIADAIRQQEEESGCCRSRAAAPPRDPLRQETSRQARQQMLRRWLAKPLVKRR